MRILKPVAKPPGPIMAHRVNTEMLQAPNQPFSYPVIFEVLSEHKGWYVPIACETYLETTKLYQYIKQSRTGILRDAVIRTNIVYIMDYDLATVKVSSVPVKRGKKYVYEILCRFCEKVMDRGGKHTLSCPLKL